MRSIERVAGAVPRSNCGRASGCVLPLSVVSFVSSTPSRISGRAPLTIAGAACCAALTAQIKNGERITAAINQDCLVNALLGRDTGIAGMGHTLRHRDCRPPPEAERTGEGGTRSSLYQAGACVDFTRYTNPYSLSTPFTEAEIPQCRDGRIRPSRFCLCL